ncbi:uncharacterized protein M421DRAFT_325448 [Didymella exigua CBS 183.55]|uniref:Uncharacterized protein n=1 Tax=Didymella exigua CBS 183.55 TaxID=1150837 RepID=A0A6A5R823_9PLEO|nr:uncharacterized protein M421DRAFT_325448 [Didymella exigua CBS 183.55]KAF1923459.1 hypothetical protein M421DRAFT_325448 [Didymella exigua CBS 183.55]
MTMLSSLLTMEWRPHSSGTVSRVLVILLAGDERCIKRRHNYGDKGGIGLPCVHSTARPNLAACLFRTSHSSLRRRAHADTATCGILCNLRISKTRELSCPMGGGGRRSYTHAPDCVTPDSGGWEPQTKRLPPMKYLLDQEVTIWDTFPTILHGT